MDVFRHPFFSLSFFPLSFHTHTQHINSTGGFTKRVYACLSSLSVLFPNRLQVIQHEFDDRSKYRAWLIDNGFRTHFTDPTGQEHTTSPCVWIGKGTPISTENSLSPPDPADIEKYLGGHDATLDWCRSFFGPPTGSTTTAPKSGPWNKVDANMVSDGHTTDHSYDYDLIVIGGGSGGMAAAKEASRLGARVALCDFVKPSPHGTTWGLGGTCVNVGCIPKKLFHIGATLRDTMTVDSNFFGISVGDGTINEMGQLSTPSTNVNWDVVKSNIQNYIRGLNFKYRVRLREKNVEYLNKLATFKDAHTVEVVDKKGRSSTITSSRFLIAVGGRPSPIDCEGGELAISSDDVFFLDKDPGKTLCIGASYISLECAGFLAGFGNDVTVAVRSILLRGFDRECADKIHTYMVDHGVKFKMEVIPTKMEKVDGDKIMVTFSDGSTDIYDTVLGAIGRYADTDKLGLGNVGIQTNPNNKKILTNFEQTEVPNIYAVGDVMEVRLPKAVFMICFF